MPTIKVSLAYSTTVPVGVMSGSILGSLDSTRLTRSTTDVAATTDQNSELHVFYYVGAAITLAASLFVIFSYLKVREHMHMTNDGGWHNSSGGGIPSDSFVQRNESEQLNGTSTGTGSILPIGLSSAHEI